MNKITVFSLGADKTEKLKEYLSLHHFSFKAANVKSNAHKDDIETEAIDLYCKITGLDRFRRNRDELGLNLTIIEAIEKRLRELTSACDHDKHHETVKARSLDADKLTAIAKIVENGNGKAAKVA